MCRLNASLRFDDAVRNLDEAVALQSCSAPVSTGAIEETFSTATKKNWMATCSGISLTGRADRSEMPIECTAIGACSGGPRRKYCR
jgi:hypothetical protein